MREIQGPVKSRAVVNFMEEMCGLLGAPKEFRSDNGPQYSSEGFKTFCQTWGIKHSTSSLHYPRSNGFIERQIGWLKPIVKKCLQNNQNINKALLHVRATPVSNRIPSLGELIMGRRILTSLPSHDEPNMEDICQTPYEKKEAQKEYYDQRATKYELLILMPGQQVHIRQEDMTWDTGTVIQKCEEPRSYIIEKDTGIKVRRNRSHLREKTVPREAAQRKESPASTNIATPDKLGTQAEITLIEPPKQTAENMTSQGQDVAKN